MKSGYLAHGTSHQPQQDSLTRDFPTSANPAPIPPLPTHVSPLVAAAVAAGQLVRERAKCSKTGEAGWALMHRALSFSTSPPALRYRDPSLLPCSLCRLHCPRAASVLPLMMPCTVWHGSTHSGAAYNPLGTTHVICPPASCRPAADQVLLRWSEVGHLSQALRHPVAGRAGHGAQRLASRGDPELRARGQPAHPVPGQRRLAVRVPVPQERGLVGQGERAEVASSRQHGCQGVCPASLNAGAPLVLPPAISPFAACTKWPTGQCMW
jgi:hypothetical protein